MTTTNSTSKHTEGPWTVEPRAFANGRPHQVYVYADEAIEGDRLAAVAHGNSYESAAERARLIAAAPDLLAAAAEAMKAIDRHGLGRTAGGAEGERLVLNALADAILKAQGRAVAS